MNDVLSRWNQLDPHAAAEQILPCCGSRAWAEGMAARRPLPSPEALLGTSDLVWGSISREAWMEAFASHPRIGQDHAAATPQSLAWSAGEQAAATREHAAKAALAEGNRLYEQKFGRIFIVCATGKSGPEVLTLLGQRIQNDPEAEIAEAAEQQRQITHLRLRKWLGGL